ncbi:general transcription factor 3C polypeptide 6 [Mugil cephalus]|uniref:general transcription factor 3C polypeptide 6 n=1 Tax=Mugil cephalus TaxID=48193 RepID=UPI001FB5A552|nr:general transcription factor 3C polypeptide 6 [Mugil cephalus]XP_047451505.1 general transcription factor 3C polypeptide 6 [Mugil cephalus]
MDDEWEEEEQLVVVEVSGIINSESLSRSTCKILDVDSERPMMQIGQYVFAGEYEDTLGTCVLFEETQRKGKANSGTDLKYMCHTAKKLKMQRIFLTDKKEGETSAESEVVGEERNTSCELIEEENDNQQTEEEMGHSNTDLEDSAVG